MDRIIQPSKEEVREWLNERQATHKPPPGAEQIRRELGWKLAQAQQKNDLHLREK